MARADALAGLLAAPIAHRGLHACGGRGPVENSLAAAEAAVVRGYGIECDIRLSRDGEAMIFHDLDLARLTGREGRIADHDADALTAMPLGHGPDRIPTLTAFLAAVDGRTPLVVEIKSGADADTRLADRALALLAGYRGVVALESFDPAVVLHCRRAGARCLLGLVGPHADDASPDPAALAASDFLSWEVGELERVGRLGMPLSTWTVRTPAEYASARGVGAQVVFEGFLPEPVAAR